MTRGVARYIVGSLVLVALVGCRGFVEERDPWRHEAEVECLKSGAVREGPAITIIRPIQGPGTCGADFPLKVSALGSGQALGFNDELRPPGSVPRYSPAPARYDLPQAAPGPPYYAPPANESGAPMPIGPPGVEPVETDGPGAYQPMPSYGAPSAPPRGPLAPPQTAAPYPPAEQVPLGPPRAPPAVPGYAMVTPTATLACPVVSMLDRWIVEGVQPAALKWFGQPVVEIKQISAYSCRSMNGQRGAPISEHAFGNALDVAAFTLADGRRITVKDGWHGAPEERGFLHDVQGAACERFSTVLAPGSNAFHYDHIHVDLARHNSGRRFCNPKPIPGDLVAGRPGDPFTGSIGARRPTRMPARERDDRILPRAEPGED